MHSNRPMKRWLKKTLVVLLLILFVCVPLMPVSTNGPIIQAPHMLDKAERTDMLGIRQAVIAHTHWSYTLLIPIIILSLLLCYLLTIHSVFFRMFIPARLKSLFLMPIKFTSMFVAKVDNASYAR
ncbi:hypothetical protein GCM10010916_44930 [Paenibacillus abyssi]|uniref:Uncharacterized protein n=1 Tax=Paenibacillus abyssi TaxID=1340531 RepID=A0A917G5Y2_9BACL|nr:hypothetical protein GCM10010916_44930 [Paenibacillus abyssi]